MVIFIKVKDNVKNKLNNQLAETFIFFQYKTYGEKITYRQGPGGSSRTPVSKFQQFRAWGEKKILPPNVSVKIRNLHGSQIVLQKTS